MELKVTQEVAKNLVQNGTTPRSRSVQTISRPAEVAAESSEPLEIHLVQLRSEWTNSAGLWRASACIVINDRADYNQTFDVVAPAASSKPNGTSSQRFYIIRREDRWEAIKDAVEIPRYLSGSGIQVSGDGTGNYVIDNAGLREWQIPGETVKPRGTLYLDNTCFKRIPSTLDIVGGYEVSLKTRYVTVVTGTVRDGRLDTSNLTTDVVRVIER